LPPNDSSSAAGAACETLPILHKQGNAQLPFPISIVSCGFWRKERLTQLADIPRLHPAATDYQCATIRHERGRAASPGGRVEVSNFLGGRDVPEFNDIRKIVGRTKQLAVRSLSCALWVSPVRSESWPPRNSNPAPTHATTLPPPCKAAVVRDRRTGLRTPAARGRDYQRRPALLPLGKAATLQ